MKKILTLFVLAISMAALLFTSDVRTASSQVVPVVPVPVIQTIFVPASLVDLLGT